MCGEYQVRASCLKTPQIMGWHVINESMMEEAKMVSHKMQHFWNGYHNDAASRQKFRFVTSDCNQVNAPVSSLLILLSTTH